MNNYKKILSVLSVSLLFNQNAMALQLEEVLVTAQKKVESVQEIPMAIDVVSGDSLAELGITSTTDLDNVTSGLVIQESFGQFTVTVRGLGTAPGSESFDQSVSLFIDGVYAGRQREFASAMYDIARVEVIKGTQNSLLGKNTSLGAISLITQAPEEEFSGYLNSSYEMFYGSKLLTGAVNIPVSDNFRLRFATNQVDSVGHVENVFTGKVGPTMRKESYRMKASFDMNDYTDVSFSYQTDTDKGIGQGWEVTSDTTGNVKKWDPEYTHETTLNNSMASYTSYGKDGQAFDDQKAQRMGLHVNTILSNDFSLAAVLGYSQYDNHRTIDADFSSRDFLSQVLDSSFEQKTFEARIASPGGETIDYTLGFLYLDSVMNKTDSSYANYPGAIGSPGFGTNESLIPELNSALQDLLTWSFNDPNAGKLNEFVSEYLDFAGLGDVLATAQDYVSGDASFEDVLQGAGVLFPNPEFGINDFGASLLYGSYASHFEQQNKTHSIFGQGVFYANDDSSITLGLRYTDEEKIATLERVKLGEELDIINVLSYPLYEETHLNHHEYSFDGSLNFSYFVGESNMLYLSYGKGTKSGGFADAATQLKDVAYEPEIAETYEIGFKGEFLGGAARLNAAIFHTDIQDYQYVQFVGLGFETDNLQANNNGFEIDGEMLLSENLGLQGSFTYVKTKDIDTGLVLPLSPELTANLGVQYNNTYKEYKYSFGGSLGYRSEMYHGLNEQNPIGEAITRVDSRIAFGSEDDQWEIALVGKNLTDELVSAAAGLQPGIADGNNRVEATESPRTIALQANFKF